MSRESYLEMLVHVTDRADVAMDGLQVYIDDPMLRADIKADFIDFRNTIELQKHLVTKLGEYQMTVEDGLDKVMTKMKEPT